MFSSTFYRKVRRVWEKKRGRGEGGRKMSTIYSPSPLFQTLIHRSSTTNLNRLISINLKQQRRRTFQKIRSSSGSTSAPSDDVVELPLFPLPLVLFPGAILPLQIFEFRYRILMHTLLQTDLRFGVIFSDSGGSVTGVGCVGEIVKHEKLVDDRFFLICKGQERFRVNKIVRSMPYLVAEVNWLEDKPSSLSSDNAEELAAEVEAHMRNVIRISNRLNGKEASVKDEEEKEEKDEEKEYVNETMDLRRNMFPTPFSFFVGSTFEGAPKEQQALLELEDTIDRLKREKDTLKNTLNYLTAASAVKDVFPSSSSSSS
ncbi:ATP-dependent protease La (LON) domain protein [Zostera marina]|uniref:ATP-dependent protease La (LON) domain protein n=1 Tax=Zostera marina TaxID=29655 RepID=A0A0K9PV03_ZOSMR|nr:ATP-dependent protease La (LON) domain protein [Zostera marina]